MRISYHIKDKKHSISALSLRLWAKKSKKTFRFATDELTLSAMRLIGGQKQNRAFPGSILSLVSPQVTRFLSGGLPIETQKQNVPSTKN